MGKEFSSRGELIGPREIVFTPRKVAIATNTLYRKWYPGAPQSIGDTDKIRGDLALQTFRAALFNGFHMIVADGGSSSDFVAEVANLEKEGCIFVRASEIGRGPQRRVAFERTSREDVTIIVYTQPEKVSLIQNVKEIALPIFQGGAEIVIPKRDQDLFKSSYPDYMCCSEVLVNRKFNTILQSHGLLKSDQELDWFFGPVVFKNNPDILALFLKQYKSLPQSQHTIDKYVDPDNRSNGHYFPIVEALGKGLKVASVTIPFVYPSTQRDNECALEVREKFIKRRITDRFGYLAELIHFVRYLEQSPKSKLYIEKE